MWFLILCGAASWRKNTSLSYRENFFSITFITVGEMYYGAEKRKWGEEKRKLLETTLRNFVVIPYDNEISKVYGRVVAERERNGRPISCADTWISACAVRHNTPLLTHNPGHFEGISGLQVVTGLT